MAISRLLQAKSALHLPRVGIVKPTRWCYSSSNGEAEKSSQSKKPSAAKEQKAVAVESFVKEYMETHPGTFPKAKHVQNKVGGSWYTLKDILSNLKEKMLENPQLQNHTTHDTSDSTVDATASEVIPTHNNKNISELGEAKSTVMSSEINKDNISSTATSYMLGENSSKNMINATASEIVQTCSNTGNIELSGPISIVQSSKSLVNSDNNEKNTTNATSHISEECSSANSVNLEAFEVIKMHDYPDSIELAEPACKAQLPEAEVVSHDNEKGISTSAMSHIINENSSEDLFQSDNTSDRSKIVESENGLMKPERAVSDNIRPDGYHKSKLDLLSCFHVSTEASTTSHVTLNESASTRRQNHQPEAEMMTSGFRPNARSEVGSTPISFDKVQNLSGLADLFTRRLNNRAAGDMTGEKNDSVTPNSFEYSNETRRKDKETSFDIKSLIDCIREIPREQSINKSHGNIMSNKIDQTSNRDAIRGMLPEANLRRSDIKGRKTSLNGHNIGMLTNNFNESEGDSGTGALFKVYGTNSKSEDKEGSDADIASFHHIKSKPSPQVLFPTSKEDLNKTQNAFLAAKGSDGNKVLVSFLPEVAKKSDIDSIFKDCGRIANIKFHAKGGPFRFASVYFKTKEGMQKALEKPYLVVGNRSVVVEAACSTENDVPNRTLIPDLIGDPDVPASLVKNPTRTVMVKQLTPDISSHDIKKTLAFCGINVSGFFFGSSSSTAYVEFETEEAKQKALEKHSIKVSGKQLFIFRIDAPRTTVVRISSPCFLEVKNKVPSICESFGRVKFVIARSKEVADVHFKLTEWPNMLTIVNGLNGLRVDGSQWIAQPAFVFPTEVLHVLWNHPDERRRLKTQIHSLSQKLDEYPLVGLTSMTNEYYRMINE